MSIQWTPEVIVQTDFLLTAAKHTFHASFTLLIYDHLITLEQEISRIWTQPWNLNKVLFMLNRYVSPTQYILQILTLDLPAFSGPACEKLYRLPYASTLYATALAEIILILRTYALFSLSRRVLIFLTLLFAGHVSIMITATIKAQKYILPRGLVGCTLYAHGLANVFFWAAPCIADTTILLITVWRCLKLSRKDGVRSPLLHVMARDGLLYYAVIVGIDVVNISMYLFATSPGVKPMGAAFCQILTTVMISRLQLNLRAPTIWAGISDVERERERKANLNFVDNSGSDVTSGSEQETSASILALTTLQSWSWTDRQIASLGGVCIDNVFPPDPSEADETIPGGEGGFEMRKLC